MFFIVPRRMLSHEALTATKISFAYSHIVVYNFFDLKILGIWQCGSLLISLVKKNLISVLIKNLNISAPRAA